jgi:pentatricopeptide repeat protein
MQAKLFDSERIKELLLKMDQENLSPDVFTYNTLLDMYGQLERVDLAESVFFGMESRGVCSSSYP